MQPHKAAVGLETAPVQTAERCADVTAVLAGRKEKWGEFPVSPASPGRLPAAACVGGR